MIIMITREAIGHKRLLEFRVPDLSKSVAVVFDLLQDNWWNEYRIF
jgi:hypothetical protein